MILLGLSPTDKAAAIRARIAEVKPSKVYVISPARFAIPGWSQELTEPETECDGRHGLFIDWPHVICYRWFYRLLQEIDGSTLLVLNEPLRTQNRHDLAYNCIRQYLNQAGHVLVFSTLPMIDTFADFMILADFVTGSRWKREPFAPSMLAEISIHGAPLVPTFEPVPIVAPPAIHATYAAERERLFAMVRDDVDKDPHQIPRNLHLVSGPAKVGHVMGRPCLGRNNRCKVSTLETYRDASTEGERIVFDWPHNFIDYADALTITRAPHAKVLVTDTKADKWYFDRYSAWLRRLADAATTLHG